MSLLLALPLLLQTPAAAGPADEGPQTVEAVVGPEGFAARAGDLGLPWKELDRVLVDRYAMSEEGRPILQHLLETAMLRRLAEERRVRVDEEEIDRRLDQLDREIRASGDPGGLAAQLRDNRVDRRHFRDMIRLAVVQELLTREALGLEAGKPVTGDQQEIFIRQVLLERGRELLPPPWTTGVAARAGSVVVSAEEATRELRLRLPPDDVRQTCQHLLLEAGLEEAVAARMPDLAPEAVARAVEEEIERRRVKAAAVPEYEGVDYETVLKAQGMRLDTLRHDPSVRVAALSWLWVDRVHGEDGLRRTYEGERRLFDDRFGRAVQARFLFLRAAHFVNDLNPRSFGEALEELGRMAREVRLERDFVAAVSRRSEHLETRQKGGALGFITREDSRLPRELTESLFRALDTGLEIPEGGRTFGPVQVPEGVALLWLQDLRPAPSWEEMRPHVHHELRRRILVELVPPDSIVTFLD